MSSTENKIREWFEANYLDGDKVQEGQMLSSETCLEAIQDALSSQKEEIKEMIEGMKKYWDVEFPNNKKITMREVKEIDKYNQALSDLLSKL